MKNSSASNFLTSLLLFVSFSIALSAQNKTCYPKDLQTLKQIYAAFSIDTPSGDCCGWNSVICDNHHPFPVIQLSFSDNHEISGQIPAAIGDLSSLGTINFVTVPNLTGNIPPAITKLSKLTSITISNTGLSGQIPTFLANIKKLTLLDLSLNAFSGSIPHELSRLPQLTSLGLVRNKLTGTIPESFGQSKLTNLGLEANFLTGTIPTSFSNLDFQVVDFSQNNFTGNPSFLFGKNKSTTFLFLRGNHFTFNLSKVEFPTNLQNLDLSKNKIFGSLPQQLTQLNLNNFDVSYNRLCGEIPQGGQLQSFEIVSFFHNKCLCGSPLPLCKRVKKDRHGANYYT